MEEIIRNPKQKRAILKKEKIIEKGFQLICENGYYNTNTKEIALAAGVSTGIIYQYFKDKHDIFMAGLTQYGDEIFFPMLKIDEASFSKDKLEDTLKDMIYSYIEEHKVSKIAHEEITAMIHSDVEVAEYFYQRELFLTEEIKKLFLKNGFSNDGLTERVHIMIGLIDHLCHEVIYHQHSNMNYEVMIEIVISTILSLFTI